jgi:hypothetical protein
MTTWQYTGDGELGLSRATTLPWGQSAGVESWDDSGGGADGHRGRGCQPARQSYMVEAA